MCVGPYLGDVQCRHVLLCARSRTCCACVRACGVDLCPCVRVVRVVRVVRGCVCVKVWRIVHFEKGVWEVVCSRAESIFECFGTLPDKHAAQ